MSSSLNIPMRTSLSLATISLALAGCTTIQNAGSSLSSRKVSDEVLQSKTAVALGLQASDFTLTDIVKDGMRYDYKAVLNSGGTRTCYLYSQQSIGSRTVSDAICSNTGSQSSSSNKCDALKKAAGKC